MERICATPTCSEVIPPQKGRQRPRKFCTSCRPPRGRPNPRVIKLQRPEPAEPRRGPGLVEAYRRQLESVERSETPAGVHALMLAELLVAGEHTAAGVASLSRELRAAMDDAMEGAAQRDDWLDELAKRREMKASSAG